MMNSLYAKAINEALSLQRATLGIIRNNRGKKFLIKDTQPYLNTVKQMKAEGEQEEIVFSLHKDSIKTHYELLHELTRTLNIKDEPYTEHFQTPALLEILYEEDPDFREFTEKFIENIGRSKDIILMEGERKYNGFYGPTCSLDFALTPGSTSNVLNQIMRRMNSYSAFNEKERYYARTILASKSWGMNTPYGFGLKFLETLEKGKSEEEAVREEIKILQFIFDEPLRANKKIMEEVGFNSFDHEDYLREYKKRMQTTVKKAIYHEVHYGNIISLPALSVGDIGHHLCQSIYDLCEDDLSFSFLETMVDVMENTMGGEIEKYKSIEQILSVATGSIAASITSILESEGLTSDMVIRLMIERFKNVIRKYPYRGIAIELHNVDFMDVIYRGNRILMEGSSVSNIPIDFNPLKERGILRNFKGFIYPNFGMTSRFATLMKFSDHLCLLNGEPATIGLLTNMISLNPRKSIAPIVNCKHCAVSSVIKERCDYCERKKAI